MSYNYAYQPKVENPNLPTTIPQMASGGFQVPFFFGGSQVPVNLGLHPRAYNGSSGAGVHHKGHTVTTMPRILPFMKS